MPVPSPRYKILPVRGNIASLNAALADLVEGEICYAFDEDQYYQKEGGVLVPVGATKAQGLLADSAIQPGDNVSELTNDAAYVNAAGAAAAAPVQSVAGKTGVVTLVKADVGLSNVDNTSDLDKPISTATQSALNLKADLVGGVIPNSQLPSLAISEYLGSVNSQAAMLALTGQRGDWCIRTDTGSTWVITTDGGSLLSDWTQLATPADAVASVNGYTGTVVLGKVDVGLGNVDNTSDLSKPVSTATQTALNLKANLASPALTGTPTAPTATAGTNTTQLATTAFVGAAITAAAVPSASETVQGKVELATAAETTTGTDNTRAVHPAGLKVELDKKANLASPALTGTPTAPTATAGTNTTQIATTAFVTDAVNTADEWTRTGTTLAPKTAGDVVAVSAGTAALPGLSVVGDADTGISSSAANTLDISTGGTGRVRVNSTVQTLNEIYGSTYYPVVTQVDVGTGSNQIPLNSYLGTMAFQDASAFTGSIGLGSASYPSLSVTGDENTGLYSPGADQLAISTGGTGRLFVDASGKVGVNKSAPAAQLHINGASSATNLLVDATGTAFSVYNDNAIGEVRLSAVDTAGTNTKYLTFYTNPTGSSNGVERMRITNDGYLRLAGAGIQFNGDTADANSLDDYEEGTFTPTIIGTSTAGTGTYTQRIGNYTKAGNRVFFKIFLIWTAHTGTGNMRVSGLPYTAAGTTFEQSALAVSASDLAFPGSLGAFTVGTTTLVYLRTFSTGSAEADVAIDTAGTLKISGSYRA